MYQPDASADSKSACARPPRKSDEIAQARAYVIETANPGYTMTLQGMELAIGRLHPEFVVRLANAIREARNAGLTFAGVFSAYRPPAFGVGGFSDKFHSLHTYGLAVDMHGIGRPGSPEAQRWHEIAASNGVVCPYGPRNRAEWNHCQPTSLKIVLAENPLRETVTADGPLDLESMFEVGNAVIDSMASAAESLTRIMTAPAKALEAAAKKIEAKADVESREESKPSLARASDKSKRSPAKSTSARIVKAAAKKIEAKANLESKEEAKRSLAKATSARAVKAAKKIEVAKADLERKEGAGRA